MSDPERELDLPMGGAYVLSPHSRGTIIEDVWPTLFFGAERAAEIRRRVENCSWARAVLDRMLKEAERPDASGPPQLPIEPAGSRHDFYKKE